MAAAQQIYPSLLGSSLPPGQGRVRRTFHAWHVTVRYQSGFSTPLAATQLANTSGLTKCQDTVRTTGTTRLLRPVSSSPRGIGESLDSFVAGRQVLALFSVILK